MANKKISQLDAASAVNSDAVFPLSQLVNNNETTQKGTVEQIGSYIAGTQTHSSLNTTSKILIGAINELSDEKADETDLASIHITGSTNNTGSAIPVGTYFYLNGALVRAIDAIATGATLTLNTNYVTITAGSLNEFAPKAGTLTNMHSSFSGSGINSLTRTGRVCVISFYRAITGSIGGTAELATLPSGFIPYANTRLYMNSIYNGTIGAFSVEVTTGGKVVATVGSGNLTSAMTILGTYICS